MRTRMPTAVAAGPRRWALWAAVLAGGAAAAGLLQGRLAMDLLVTALVFASLATAWNIAGGLTGMFSLGHGALFAIGAYGAALPVLRAGWPMPAAIGVSALAAGAAAATIGLMSLRLRAHFFALATLAIGMAVALTLANLRSVTGGDEGLSIPFAPDAANLIFADKRPYAFLALGLYALASATVIAVLGSRWGIRMRAVAGDEVAAHAAGVPVLRTKLVAMATSGVLSGLAGSLFACYTLHITPGNSAGIDVSLQPALMAIIGGTATVFGPLVGSVLLTLLDEYVISAVGAAVPGLSDLVYGLLLIGCILLLPGGILGRRAAPAAGADPADRAGPADRAARSAPGDPPVAEVPPDPAAARTTPGPEVLRADGISLRRGGLQILDDVDLTAAAGTITAVIGPNGAGKTSLFNVLSGFTAPDAGRVRLAGRDITGARPARICRAGLARTFQHARTLPGLTVAESVLVAALSTAPPHRARRRTRSLLRAWDLDAVGREDSAILPDGAAGRLQLARALATGPRVLLCDEVLAGTTPDERAAMVASLRALAADGLAIVLVEHHLGTVLAVSDRVVVLHAGRRIAAGTPAEVAEDPAVQAAYLGGVDA